MKEGRGRPQEVVLEGTAAIEAEMRRSAQPFSLIRERIGAWIPETALLGDRNPDAP